MGAGKGCRRSGPGRRIDCAETRDADPLFCLVGRRHRLGVVRSRRTVHRVSGHLYGVDHARFRPALQPTPRNESFVPVQHRERRVAQYRGDRRTDVRRTLAARASRHWEIVPSATTIRLTHVELHRVASRQSGSGVRRHLVVHTDMRLSVRGPNDSEPEIRRRQGRRAGGPNRVARPCLPLRPNRVHALSKTWRPRAHADATVAPVAYRNAARKASSSGPRWPQQLASFPSMTLPESPG